MTHTYVKKAPLCLALALFALPAMADNIFSGVITFGREMLDETRKLAPGVQHDRRHEAPAPLNSAPDDGRDYPAIEAPNAGYNSTQGNHNVMVAAPMPAPLPAAPAASNNGLNFVEEDHMK